jgi:hypothetical protein
MSSPEGIFCLVGKEQNAVLKGEGYETPVSYWMPFYGGVGIHDADSWRTSYGGTIYQYSGSHGCINTPTAQAAILFENIEIGTPIICYSSSVNYGYGETETSGGQTDDTQNVSGQTTDSAQGDGTVTDDTIVILDGGGTGDEEDWADESLYYGTNDGVIIDDVIVLPDTTGQ